MIKTKLIRIGNDIKVKWTVKTNGADASLEDKSLTVRLNDIVGTSCNITWSVEGNVITVNYAGKLQKRLGHYTLVLIDTTGGGMKTVDVCKAFELVPYSFLAGGSDASNIETEVVELTSSIEYGTFVEIDDTLSVKGMAADAKKTGEELAKKVEKVTGKGLSTNDYTDAEKLKLSSALTEHQDITGKADVFCINLTTSGIDKTYAQIKEAVAAGKVIIGDYYGKGKVQFLPSLTKTEQDQAIVFAYARSGGRMIGTIIIRANGRAEIYDGGVDITDRTTPSGIDVGSYLPWSDRYVYGNAQTGMYACSSLLVTLSDGTKRYIIWYEYDATCPKKVYSYSVSTWGAHRPEQMDANRVLYCDTVYDSSDAANWPTWLKRIFNIDSRSKIDEYEQRITAIESVEIVDNLTTDDADKPLSAKQGKVLNEKILKIVDLEKYKDGSTIVEDLNKSCVYTVNFGSATQMLSDSSKSSLLGFFVSFNNGDYYCFISHNTSGYYISSWVDTTVEKIYQADFVTEAEWDYSEAEELIRMYYPWRLSNSSVEVVDNLTTDDSAKALSAKQGKVLNDTKQNSLTTAQMSAVNSGITSADKTKLDSIPANANHTDIVDNITSDDSTKALSAKQGKVLSEMISQHSSVEVVDNLTSDDATKALSAKQGKVLNTNMSNIARDVSQIKERDNFIVLDGTGTFSSQVTSENTIYEIWDDFDLAGANVNIPSNCTLWFKGGKIYNGNVKYEGTLLLGDVRAYANIASGSWISNAELDANWFGAVVNDETFDNAVVFERFHNLNGNGTGFIMKFSKGTYHSSSFRVAAGSTYSGEKNATIFKAIANGTTYTYSNHSVDNVFIAIQSPKCELKDITIDGGSLEGYNNTAIGSYQAGFYLTVKNVRIKNCSNGCFHSNMSGGFLTFENCDFYTSGLSYCILFEYEMDMVVIRGCDFEGWNGSDYSNLSVIKISNITSVVKNVLIENNRFEEINCKYVYDFDTSHLYSINIQNNLYLIPSVTIDTLYKIGIVAQQIRISNEFYQSATYSHFMLIDAANNKLNCIEITGCTFAYTNQQYLMTYSGDTLTTLVGKTGKSIIKYEMPNAIRFFPSGSDDTTTYYQLPNYAVLGLIEFKYSGANRIIQTTSSAQPLKLGVGRSDRIIISNTYVSISPVSANGIISSVGLNNVYFVRSTSNALRISKTSNVNAEADAFIVASLGAKKNAYNNFPQKANDGYIHFDNSSVPYMYISNGEDPYGSTYSTSYYDIHHLTLKKGGTTEDRNSLNILSSDVGFCFFDSTLGKPIWWNGTSWVDSTGASV